MYLVGSIHWVLQQRLLTGALLFASKSSHVHHSKLIDASESLHHPTTFYIVLMYIHILMRILFILYALYIFVHNIHIYVYIYYIILCLYIYIHKMHINLMTRILIVNPSPHLGGLRPIPNPSGKSKSESSNVEVDGTAGFLKTSLQNQLNQTSRFLRVS